MFYIYPFLWAFMVFWGIVVFASILTTAIFEGKFSIADGFRHAWSLVWDRGDKAFLIAVFIILYCMGLALQNDKVQTAKMAAECVGANKIVSDWKQPNSRNTVCVNAAKYDQAFIAVEAATKQREESLVEISK